MTHKQKLVWLPYPKKPESMLTLHQSKILWLGQREIMFHNVRTYYWFFPPTQIQIPDEFNCQ